MVGAKRLDKKWLPASVKKSERNTEKVFLAYTASPNTPFFHGAQATSAV
jgi:hypothetical protein